MKAQLVKRQDRFDLYNELDGSKIASTLPNPMGKLSIANCESVFQSIQTNEFDVEIEMEPYIVGGNEDFIGDGETHIIETKLRPQLDVDGCLILKRK
jgi:hypothetical protein